MARSGTFFLLLRRWLRLAPPALPEIQQAQQLIKAIDAGGVPLNPARINQIARNLGLEVSIHAATEDTVERIRAALRRV
jgi:hypothetical protein